MMSGIFRKLKHKYLNMKSGRLSVIGGFLVMFTFGEMYSNNNLAPSFLKYLQDHSVTHSNITIGEFGLINSFNAFGWGVAMSFGVFMVPKFGTVLTILIGGWTMSLGILLTFWTIHFHFVLVVITNGLIVGLGMGIAYGTIVSIPWKWFPNSKGLVTGIVVAGFGLSSTFSDVIQTYSMKPINITKCVLENSNDISPLFLYSSLSFAAIQFIGAILIHSPNENNNNCDTDLNYDTATEYSIIESEVAPEQINVNPQSLICRKNFWVLWIIYTLTTIDAVIFLSLHKKYGEALHLDCLYITVTSAIGGLFNSGGRIIWGYFIDRFSFKVLMSILTFSMAVMFGTFIICSKLYDKTGTYPLGLILMYFIWVILLHFIISGNFSIFPIVCINTFGEKYSLINYGLLFTSYALGGIVSVSIATSGLLDKIDNAELFRIPFLIGMGISILALCFTQLFHSNEH